MGRECKTVVAGTGRCGTTCLIQILSRAGMDTGLYTDANNNWMTNVMGRVSETDPSNGRILRIDRTQANDTSVFSERVNAGCETLLCLKDKPEFVANKIPEVIKDPRLAWYGHELLDAGILKIRHMIVCIRKLEHVAASKSEGMKGYDTGKWYQHSPDKIYDISAWQLGVCISEMTTRRIPLTLLEFPLFTTDSGYFLEKMLEVFPTIQPKVLQYAWKITVNPELVHYS